MRRARRWIWPEGEDAEGWPGFSRAATSVLKARGIGSPEAAAVFLAPTRLTLHRPQLMMGMARAVELTMNAVEAGDPITVYGDYDADGLCAASILERALLELGANVEVYLPSRFEEGYGLHGGSLQRLAEAGRRLVISVDCGMRAVQEVEVARRAGLVMIVTDHHEPGPALPAAEAVVNPRQPGDAYPEKNLAGSGVSYKLAEALLEARGLEPGPEALALVAVGTIADMVPLTGENRALAALGLRALNDLSVTGLAALMETARLAPGKVTAGDVGYRLAPRLNAAGRMGSPEQARRLLGAADRLEAKSAAATLEEANRKRQEETLLATNRARAGLGDGIGDLGLLFACDEAFSEGIIGLVAARLTDEFYRPAVVVSLGEEFSKGSARSVAGFDITRALDACAELLERHGGHERAAGFTIRTGRVEALRTRLLELAAPALAGEKGEPRLRIDAALSLEEVDSELLRFVRSMEPCGMGNPEPLFASTGVTVIDRKAVGSAGEHLKLRLRQGWRTISAIAFRQGEQAATLPERVDVAFHLQVNDYWGTPEIELGVEALRPAGA